MCMTKNPNDKSCKFREKLNSVSKIFIAAFFVLVGVIGTLLAQQVGRDPNKNFAKQNFENVQQDFDDFFDDDDFAQDMKEMEQNVNKIIHAHQRRMEKAFKNFHDHALQNGETEISAKEDNEAYFYELEFSHFKKDEINIEFKDKMLTFTASNKKSKDKNYASSSFYYSFLLPAADEKKAPEINREDDKITVKIPKKK